MATVLTIRDVPDDVKEALTREARERGQSLQAYLLTVLKRQAAFSRNRQLLVEIERDLALGGGADEDAPDAADVLADARRETLTDDHPTHGNGGAA
jgi:plasmid stability protein